MTKLSAYRCDPGGCRCPGCDAVMAAVAAMDPATYAEYVQRTTAAMLGAAPSGPGIRRAQMRHMGVNYTTTAAPPNHHAVSDHPAGGGAADGRGEAATDGRRARSPSRA